MKTDLEVQQDVMNELRWEPLLKAAEIGVAVKQGVVTLSGKVNSYNQKLAAEKAAKRVSEVRAVAEEIEVGMLTSLQRTDAEIAASILQTLKWHGEIEEDNIRVKVEGGVVSLEGQVEWGYQKQATEKAVELLTGVKRVYNYITIKPTLPSADIRDKISAALVRSATVDAEKISVEVTGNTATLRGAVRSFAEKEDAEKAAWSAPGISRVESLLSVESPSYVFDSDGN
ncbi:BON domain-containing protein [Terrimonas sp. NA20]|uniref:BON domain-containing protein n=1 Tax=Terrimonas ginsenosidimutans TaxID=2908004 RepID=A0ABS9KVF3_9BACT|nr:BON domain-containing protein [Terrimonas ginsenosidimutans]MCG2616290.1 BON domain-containing protein [Terrimonas ginsenosidimutans]